jgi:predicted DNA-binding transcriptional regulator AlpA
MNEAAAPAEKLLVSLLDLVEMTGANRRSVLRWVDDGQLPQPLPLGRGKRWWDREEILSALLDRRQRKDPGRRRGEGR